MAFNPSQVALTYKKYLSANHVIVTLELTEPVSRIEFPSLPPWVRMISNSIVRDGNNMITELSYKVSVDSAVANLLSPGIHTGSVRADAYIDNFPRPLLQGVLNVSVDIIDNVILSLSKSSYNFLHTLGNPAPASQPLTISTEGAWSIVSNQGWLLFSSSNGVGVQTINISVDVSGMPAGLFEATFQVDDSSRTLQGTVSLLISGSEGAGDFLTVSRTSLSFSEVYQQPATRSGNIGIDTSLEVAITTATPWLELSAASFPAGTSQLIVNTKETSGLAIGNYSGSVKIESGFSTKIINVLLRIVIEKSEGITSGQLYFVEDRNTLVLGTGVNNAEALIDFISTASGKTQEYTRRKPYFGSVAQVIIGMETAALLKPENLPIQFNPGLFIPVKPLAMDFTIYDKVINSTQITERQSYAQVKFLNGATPAIQDKLSNIPASITTPADALICFSFYSVETITEIDITGAYVGKILVSIAATNVYAAVIDLAQLSLLPGNKITVACGPVSVNITIKDTQLSTYRLIYLNEWQCPEVLNFDGPIEIIEEEDSTMVSYAEAGKEIARIIETKQPRSFKVGTGNIYSDAEMKWVSNILRSKKMWLEIAGERIEVVRSFRNLTISKTRNYTRNYSLNFDAAIK
jgi:hypothetical protein